jgi:putative hydrolase of the HAD superfamily
MIRAALFDLDGVVRHFDTSGLKQIEERHGLAPGSLLKALLHPSRMEAATTGRITDAEWRKLAAEEFEEAPAEEFLRWNGTQGFVDEETLEIVRQLRGKMPVGLLTNATDRLDSELRLLRLDNEFDPIVNSSEIGFAKPDPRAFEHSASRLGFPSQEILFVDDRLENVEAATRLGFLAHHFSGVESLTSWLQGLDLL